MPRWSKLAVLVALALLASRWAFTRLGEPRLDRPMALDDPATVAEGPLEEPRVLDSRRPAVEESNPAKLLPAALLLQVVDSAGKPLAGVPIAMRRSDSGPDQPDLDSYATEGADGTARVAKLAGPQRFGLTRASLFAHIEALGFDSIGATIDLERPPTGTVRLTLPPYGSVGVRVRDAAGRPTDTGWVELFDASSTAPRETPSRAAHHFLPTERESDRDVFGFVALDRQLTVRASAPLVSAEWSGAGPTRAGQRVEIVLTLAPSTVLVSGRLVDEEQRPFASADFHCALLPAREAPAGTEVLEEGWGGGAGGMRKTDAEGRFRIRMPRFRGSLSFRAATVGYGELKASSVPFDGAVLDQEAELGDIVLLAARAVAAGRVVDDLGLPVSFAHVVGQTPPKWSEAPDAFADAGISGDCFEDGTFTVRGARPLGRLRLRATRYGYLDGVSDDVVAGASNVWITMTRAARIEGRVVRDDRDRRTRLWARSTRRSPDPDGPASPMDAERALVDHDGTFLLRNLPLGACDLVIQREGELEPLAVVEGLVLRPGEAAVDDRLAAIVLRRE